MFLLKSLVASGRKLYPYIDVLGMKASATHFICNSTTHWHLHLSATPCPPPAPPSISPLPHWDRKTSQVNCNEEENQNYLANFGGSGEWIYLQLLGLLLSVHMFWS